jgi:hypothetical protein
MLELLRKKWIYIFMMKTVVSILII